ncbi:MAG: hypothetical protein F6J93_08825 [Oscillatoria sp. SIO1A7]|nr:hypothetical protein [Oscillatoria sp. SIO1A7]
MHPRDNLCSYGKVIILGCFAPDAPGIPETTQGEAFQYNKFFLVAKIVSGMLSPLHPPTPYERPVKWRYNCSKILF